MIRHRIVGIRRLEPIAQLRRFAESGLGEMDMINVGAFTGPGGRGAIFRLRALLFPGPERMSQATG